MCEFIFQIDYSYKANTTATISNFRNSCLKESFELVYKIHEDFEKNDYQSRNAFCKCM